MLCKYSNIEQYWDEMGPQPRTQGICSWGAKYPGMVWSRDPRILRKMASCLLGLGGEYILSQLNMINLIALII